MIKQAIHKLQQKWRNRQRYCSFDAMPDKLVAFFAASGFLVSSYFGYVLAKVVPGFLAIANKTALNQWGWLGWFCLALLAGLALIVWLFGTMTLRCNKILQERWFQ